MASYQDAINELINYNDRIVTTLNYDISEITKIEDLHDFFRPEKGRSNYQPIMQPFSLSKADRNLIIGYNKLYTVQILSDDTKFKGLLKQNELLVSLIDKELN